MDNFLLIRDLLTQKTMENREVVDTYKIGIDKAIEAAQKINADAPFING